MNELTKKVLDMLFEPEKDEVTEEGPIKDISTSKQKTNPLKAKDLLYGKPSDRKPFLDYEDKQQQYKKEETNIYVKQGNVSPIFGEIRTNDRTKDVPSDLDRQRATTITNSDYQNIIISPIYGYDSTKANSARGTLKGENQNNLVSDYRNDSYSYTEPGFEMPEDDTYESVKEAVEEAVTELSSSYNQDHSEIFEDDLTIYDTMENKLDDMIEETGFTEEHDFTNINDTIDNANRVIEENKKRESEYYKPELRTHSELVDDYTKILETGEIPVIKQNKTNKSNESISLFDFDDLNNDDGKDIFDELIGDDN